MLNQLTINIIIMIVLGIIMLIVASGVLYMHYLTTDFDDGLDDEN